MFFPSSILSGRNEDKVSYINKLKENVKLRLGVIIEVTEAEDEENTTKGVDLEYRVLTMEDDNVAIYNKCITVDAFGGVADYFRFRRRTPDNPETVKKGNIRGQNGSIVLVLCLDGDSEQAIILAALAHPDKKGILTKEKEHHLEGEFNGVNVEINKDGELTITFKSPTDNDGKPSNPVAGGTSFKIEKDGSVNLTDGLSNTMRMDKLGQSFSVETGDFTATATKTAKVAATANVEVSAKARLLLEATGSATIGAGKLEISSKSIAKISAVNLELEATLLKANAGTIILKAPTVLIGPAPTPALTIATSFVGSDIFGVPVVCYPAGPFSATVGIG